MNEKDKTNETDISPLKPANVSTQGGAYLSILDKFLNLNTGGTSFVGAIGQSGILDECRITDETQVTEPPCVVTITDIRTMSQGDISAIEGHAKGRKTLFAAALCNVLLGGGDVTGPVSTDCQNPKVLYIDTEQAIGHSKRTYDRITKGTSPEARKRLFFLSMREFSNPERLAATCAAIDRHRPQFCVIDGIADLAIDVNSSTEAPAIVGILMAMASEYDCHICSILHTSAANVNKGRGHLGSELERKCETIVKVEKDLKADISGAVSSVTAQYARNQEFNNLTISHLGIDGYELTRAEQTTPTDNVKLLEMAKDYAAANVPESVPSSAEYQFETKVMIGQLKRSHYESGGKGEFSERTARRILKEAVNRNLLYEARRGNTLYYSFKDWGARRERMNGIDNTK